MPHVLIQKAGIAAFVAGLARPYMVVIEHLVRTARRGMEVHVSRTLSEWETAGLISSGARRLIRSLSRLGALAEGSSD